ncbi:hypothetical protein EVAR_86743_1 [Eumeta japonica]|uniref:Uncharacterized protein n=1 Tax=Eumeta variegata TaxID=151549 RepID=A0A4C1W0A6_EUMVA|nr:hypothetical protein EVAR_86743_1 [Eumeta japonica]
MSITPLTKLISVAACIQFSKLHPKFDLANDILLEDATRKCRVQRHLQAAQSGSLRGLRSIAGTTARLAGHGRSQTSHCACKSFDYQNKVFNNQTVN